MKAHLASLWKSTSEGEKSQRDANMFEIKVVSFGYKSGPPPNANMLFDVRFLENPYWVERLRPLTGLDKEVQNYVLEQPLAQHFLHAFMAMASEVLPEMAKRRAKAVIIAFGCTGGQHRSTSIAEYTAKKLHEMFPHYMIRISHRELDRRGSVPEDDDWSAAIKDKTS